MGVGRPGTPVGLAARPPGDGAAQEPEVEVLGPVVLVPGGTGVAEIRVDEAVQARAVPPNGARPPVLVVRPVAVGRLPRPSTVAPTPDAPAIVAGQTGPVEEVAAVGHVAVFLPAQTPVGVEEWPRKTGVARLPVVLRVRQALPIPRLAGPPTVGLEGASAAAVPPPAPAAPATRRRPSRPHGGLVAHVAPLGLRRRRETRRRDPLLAGAVDVGRPRPRLVAMVPTPPILPVGRRRQVETNPAGDPTLGVAVRP